MYEVEGAQVADVVAIQRTDGTGCISIGHGLIFKVDGVVQLVLVGFKIFKVKHGSACPVAVEGKEGTAQIHNALALCVQLYEALNVHAVFKGLIQVLFVGVTERDGQCNVCALACGNGHALTVLLAVGHGGDGDACALEQVALLGDNGLAVHRLGLADALGHDNCGNIVC